MLPQITDTSKNIYTTAKKGLATLLHNKTKRFLINIY